MRFGGHGQVRIGWGLFLTVTLVQTGPTLAETPNITTGGTISESYNDNVNLATAGSGPREDAWVTTISPSISVRTDAPRLKFGLLYNPQELLYRGGVSAQQLQQQLSSTGTAIVWPDILSFEESASIGQEAINNFGPAATTTQTTNGNVQTVESFTFAPVVRHHFGSYADSETRYTIGETAVSGGSLAALQTNTFLQRLTSGNYFGRFGWTLTGNATVDKRGTSSSDPLSGGSFRDDSARADFTYAIYQGLSALVGIGYEKINDPTLTTPPTGIIWNGGFKYAPSATTSLSLTVGRRFGETDYEFQANTDIGPQTHFTASYSESVQTGQSLISNQLGQLGFDQSGLPISTGTGLPFNPTGNPLSGVAGSPFGISSSAFMQKAAQATVIAERGRNTYSAVISDTTQQIQVPVSNQTVLTGSLNWGRQLWPNLLGKFGANYTRSVFSTISRTDNIYSVSLDFVYTISPTASASFSLLRSSTRSSIPTNDLDSDIVTVSVHKTF